MGAIWGHLTKRRKSYVSSESCQLEVDGLADRPSAKAKFGPILTLFVLRPDVQLKRASSWHRKLLSVRFFPFREATRQSFSPHTADEFATGVLVGFGPTCSSVPPRSTRSAARHRIAPTCARFVPLCKQRCQEPLLHRGAGRDSGGPDKGLQWTRHTAPRREHHRRKGGQEVHRQYFS
jgi:hypothetical protein